MDKKKIVGVIQTYSRKAREQIICSGKEIFRLANLEHVSNDMYACMDELIKNAVKANYKFIFILEKMFLTLKQEHPEESGQKIYERINAIIKNKPEYDRIAAELTANEEISRSVRNVLNEESILIRCKNKIYSEKRDYNDEERAKIESLVNLQKMRQELDKKNMKVRVSIELDEYFVYIEVTNNAPIMDKDLSRIYDKRDEYKIYRDQEKEQEFFLNNLDTSDSGFGLGYATIDSFLSGLGLDPLRSVQIIGASNTTVILSLPINALTLKD